eukprot:5517615-Amphidinium_carterae.1
MGRSRQGLFFMFVVEGLACHNLCARGCVPAEQCHLENAVHADQSRVPRVARNAVCSPLTVSRAIREVLTFPELQSHILARPRCLYMAERAEERFFHVPKLALTSYG